MLKRILFAVLFAPLLALAQSYPSPTVQNLTVLGTLTGPAPTFTTPLPVVSGGTNSASASGTALDNISGFSSTGYLKRTGAGAYSFALPIPVTDGGTGATSASGTVLDNITGFNSTGFMSRAGAGSYTFSSRINLPNLANQAANTVVANVTASSTTPTAFAMPSCSTSGSAVNYTTNTGFGCNASINAVTLGGATFSAPGPIGSTTASTGAFTTLSATGVANANSLAVSGSSTPTTNLSTVTDTVSGTITNSFRPDSVFLSRTYNGSEQTSGYTSAGDVLHPYLAYGTSNTTASGSPALLGGNINIYNSSNGPAGRSEFTPLAVAAVPIKGGTFVAGSNYYNDFNIQSAPGTGGQEGFLASGSFSVQKWTTGNTIDANHAGSYGLSVITTPNNTGYDSQTHSSDTTYPLNALAALVGWSGQQSTTSTNGGATASATAAANVGLQIGGPGGSVWGCSTCYSYIPTGINIQDYTTAAINIGSPSTGHATSGTAINIATGGGNLVVGDSVFVGTASGGGTVQMAQANVNAPVVSTQATTHFQDRGTDKWLVGKQTDNTFVMYDAANAAGFLTVSTAGLMTIGETKGVQLNPTTFAALPACSSGSNAGTIAYITDASAAITAWHQQVTAGSGGNKAFVACNGSGWFAFDN